MQLLIRVKPLSINKAFKGRRFKTKASKQYDKDVKEAIAGNKATPIKTKWYEVRYQFWLKNFGNSDYDNFIKQVQDCLVRSGFINNDNHIKKAVIEKFRIEEGGTEGTVVEILPYYDKKSNPN